MEFENQTPYAAFLFRSEFRPDLLYNALLLRTKYQILLNPEEDVTLTETFDLDIRNEPIEDEYGTIQPDDVFPRTGTDIIIFGDAMPKMPSTSMIVSVSIGGYKCQLKVYGDRHWENDGDRVIPSSPCTFQTIPLVFNNAYGGCYESPYGPLSYSLNPSGKGYCASKKDAVGAHLPNIEDPLNLIHNWDDQPKPVGVAPCPNKLLHMDRFISQCDDKINIHPDDGFFDQACPSLSGTRVLPSERFCLEGFNPIGAVAGTVPPCPAAASITIGEETYQLEMEIEEILFDMRQMTLEVCFRKSFTYEFVKHQTRRCCAVLKAPKEK